ncbi:MAG: DUF5343 domain-containing protein [Chloroflexota bacterium]
MAKDIPYMVTVKNLTAILDKVKVAQTPPKFTHEFLKSNLGFASSGDRGVIQLFKALGFLSPDSLPTQRYNEFRASSTSGRAMAAGLEEGWSDIFLSDQNAHECTQAELIGIFKNVTGKSDSVATKMATTFNTLSKLADFSVLNDVVPETPSEIDAIVQETPPVVAT